MLDGVTLVTLMALAMAGSLISIVLVSVIPAKVFQRMIEPLVSFSAGVLLAAALLHILPEAFDLGGDYHEQFAWLLGGLLLFFLLEKLSLLHHSHHHEGDGHHHHHGFDAEAAGKGGFWIILGDSVHHFADGLLIASAYLVDPALGLLTAASVAAHEIPQQFSNFIVLTHAGLSSARARRLIALSALGTVIGAVAGLTLLKGRQDWLMNGLMFTAASFLYIAVADLIPYMQKRSQWRESFEQIVFLLMGVGLMGVVASVFHHH